MEDARNSLKDIRDSLKERQQTLQECTALMRKLAAEVQGKDLYEIFAQIVASTLYSPRGTTAAELGKMLGLSRQTIYERLKPLRKSNLLIYEKVGRKTYIRMDIERLSQLYG